MSVTHCSVTTRRLNKQKAFSHFSPPRAVSGPMQSPVRSGGTFVKVLVFSSFLFFLIYSFFKYLKNGILTLKQFLLLHPFSKEQLKVRTLSFKGMLFHVVRRWKIGKYTVWMNMYPLQHTLHFIHTVTAWMNEYIHAKPCNQLYFEKKKKKGHRKLAPHYWVFLRKQEHRDRKDEETPDSCCQLSDFLPRPGRFPDRRWRLKLSKATRD